LFAGACKPRFIIAHPQDILNNQRGIDRGILNHQIKRQQDLGGARGKYRWRLSAVRCQAFDIEIAMAARGLS
jgi:hypothetical protein